MIGGLAGVVADVIPYGSVIGERAHLAGLNLVGLKRRGAGARRHQRAARRLRRDVRGRGHAAGAGAPRRRGARRQSAGAEVVDFVTAEIGALLHHPGGLTPVRGDGLAIVAGRGDAAAADRRGLRPRAAGPTASWCSTACALDWLGRPSGARGRASRSPAGSSPTCAPPAAARSPSPAASPGRSCGRCGFDLKMLRLAPRLLRGLRSGDDATLRLVAGDLRGRGLRGARRRTRSSPTCVAPPGVLGRPRPADGRPRRRGAGRRHRRGARRGRRRPGGGGGAAASASGSSRSRAPTRCSTSSRAPPPAGPAGRARAACSSRRRSPARTGASTCRRSARGRSSAPPPPASPASRSRPAA